MRPEAHAVRLRQLDHAVHCVGVARVEACGDIRGADDLHDLFIRRVTQHPLAETFAHVAIQIDCIFHGHVLLLESLYNRIWNRN